MFGSFQVQFTLYLRRESDPALLTVRRRTTDPLLLPLKTPRMDVIFPGGGTVRSHVAQLAVATRELPLLLHLFRSLRLLLENSSLAGADLLDESFPSRVLLIRCRRDGQTWNTESLTIRANKTWCLRLTLWFPDYRLLTGDVYRRNKRQYTPQQFIMSAAERRFCSEV